MGKRWRILLPGLALVGAVAALVFLRGSGGEARLPEPTEEPGPVAAAPAPAVEEALPEAAALAGVVLDTGGAPLPEAEVRARALAEDAWPAPFDDAPAATTDERGRFELRALPAGLYLLEVRDERGWGFLPVVRVSDGRRTDVTVRLLPEAEIRGRVVDANHDPIANAEVTTDLAGVIAFFRRGQEPPPEEVEKRVRTVTDGEGRFVLPRLPIGLYDLRVTASDGRHRVIPGVAAPVDGVDLTLWEGYDVPVVVTWPKDARPERIVAETVPADAREELRPEGTSASATLTVLLPGRYEVSASAPGFLVARGVAVVADGRRTEPVELCLEPAVPATVRVRRESDGRPIEGVRVVVVGSPPRPGKRGPVIEERTDAKGLAAFRLPPGLWGAVAWLEGWRISYLGLVDFRQMPESALRVVGEAPVEWEFSLRPDWVIDGRVTFEDGTPARSLEVGAWTDGPSRDWTDSYTGPDGEYELFGCFPGAPWNVWVEYAPERSFCADAVSFPEGKRRMTVDLVLPMEKRTKRRLRGRVVDESGEPVPRALVFLGEEVVASAADGTFEMEGLPLLRDTHGTVVAAGHPLTEFQWKADRDDSKPLRLVLPWRPSWLSGEVRDSAGEPVPGAALRFERSWTGDTLFVVRTDRDGNWTAPRPFAEKRRWRIEVRAPGYETRDVDAEGGRTTLLRTATVRGRVEGDWKLDGGFLDISLDDDFSYATTRALEPTGGGAFVVRGLSPGSPAIPVTRRHVRLRVPGAAVRDGGEVEFREGAEIDLGTIRLEPGGAIRGQVVDLDGRAAGRHTVEIPELGLSAGVEYDGSFLLDCVPAGQWTLRSGWRRGEMTVTVVAGRAETVRLVVRE